MTYLYLAILLLPVLAGLWMLFEKAGQKGWAAIVPIYNLYVILKLIGRPWWWLVYLFIPLIGQLIGIGVIYDFIKLYGKKTIGELIFAILLPFVYFPYIGFSKDTKYEGPEVYTAGKKDSVQEWSEAIGFAVVAATLIRWLIMEAYTIPTASMENSLLVGDFLFVSKFHYGTRTPTTPLQVPLTHQKIWFTDLPSYSEAIQLPSYRLPGISRVKREDVVVFNVPGVVENYGVQYPIDLKTNFIKRCVGVPGDVFEIRDKQIFANGVQVKNPPLRRFTYRVVADEEISEKNLLKLGIDNNDIAGFPIQQQNKVVYEFNLDSITAAELSKVSYIDSVMQNPSKTSRTPGIFSQSKYAPWNEDNFGPLTIPAKGMKIEINDSTLAFYGNTIVLFDHNKDAKIEGGKLLIDGIEQSTYTFKQNYYFMMGDNRHDSADSRFWGFVPEDHIVGKAFFIWLSIDNNASFFNKIRWSRFFNLIR